MKILIIGNGIVGKNMNKVFKSAVISDPPAGIRKPRKSTHFDIAFVCVPTPKNDDGSCDFSIVESVVKEYNPRIFCIRSTIPPGTTAMLQQKYNKPCVFSPEYYGSTIHANNPDYNFITLGGDNEYTQVVADAFAQVYPGSFQINQVSAIDAEFSKYAENCFLAVKVSFFNEIKTMSDMAGGNYHAIRNSILLDPRINPSHTWVFNKKPGWNSHCLNKDIPAFIQYAKSIGIETPVIESSLKYKRKDQ